MSTDATDVFGRLRPKLFGIAYRMLSTVVDAEDVVQNAWLRWQSADQTSVRDPAAFLSTVTTRLSINAATSARARREHYVGEWLPEPVDTSSDPALGAERAMLLDLAVLVLMERLTPVERAVFVLHEAFDYPFKLIAEIVEVSEANARQIGARARNHVRLPRHARVDRIQRDQLLRAFLTAAYSGDVQMLEQLFVESVVAVSDGGGKATAARTPVLGADRVARYVAGVVAKFAAGTTVVFVEVNSSGAALIMNGNSVIGVCAISILGDRIDRVFTIVNPDKLTRLVA